MSVERTAAMTAAASPPPGPKATSAPSARTITTFRATAGFTAHSLEGFAPAQALITARLHPAEPATKRRAGRTERVRALAQQRAGAEGGVGRAAGRRVE